MKRDGSGGIASKFQRSGWANSRHRNRSARFSAEDSPCEFPRRNLSCRFPSTQLNEFATECLDHFVLFGEKHLRYVLTEFLTHYHVERPHQGIGNVTFSSEPRILKFPSGAGSQAARRVAETLLSLRGVA